MNDVENRPSEFGSLSDVENPGPPEEDAMSNVENRPSEFGSLRDVENPGPRNRAQ